MIPGKTSRHSVATEAYFCSTDLLTSAAMASCRHILMPWEHDVCSECLQKDPHAIRLVKVHAHCFEPQRHRSAVHIPVVINQAHVMMEQIRPLPGNCFTFRGEFVHCHHFPDCNKGGKCRFGHSELEVDTWNAKKRIISGKECYVRTRVKNEVIMRSWL